MEFKLSNTALKYFAAFFMVLDHSALIFLSTTSTGYLVLRVLGRLSAPIFFWALSEGAFYTKNIKKMLLTLLLGGVIFHLVYTFFVEGYSGINNLIFGYKNIFFTLFLGLFGLALMKYGQGKYLKWLGILSIPLLAFVFNVDYGPYGILMIYLFYLLRGKKLELLIGLTILNLVFLALGQIVSYQLVSILALGLIYFYDGTRGQGNKYFFYIFYPVHFIILYGIDYLLKNFL